MPDETATLARVPSTVERKLGEAKLRLEEELGRPVTTYIPPCNRIDRGTAKVLHDLGFDLCLSEGPVPGGSLPWRRSDFYGRSSEFGPAHDAEVLTFHVTWEWDVQRGGDRRSLGRVLDALAQGARQKREIIAQLASDLSTAR